jgi:hypothetical protein
MVANPQVERGGDDYLANRILNLERTLAQVAGKSPLPVVDSVGTELIGLDLDNGWGLQSPQMDVVLYPDSPDAPTVSTATWTTLWHGYFAVIHPRLWISAMLVTKGASSVAGGLRWQITSNSMAGVTTTPTTITGVGSIQDAQTIDFTAADEGGTCTLQLQVQMSGTVVGGNIALAYPMWAWRVRSNYPN